MNNGGGGLNDRNNLGGGNYNQVSQSQSNGFRREFALVLLVFRNYFLLKA